MSFSRRIRKRQKVTGMELVPVGDESMDGALVSHSPKGNNLTIVAICNICQKGTILLGMQLCSYFFPSRSWRILRKKNQKTDCDKNRQGQARLLINRNQSYRLLSHDLVGFTSKTGYKKHIRTHMGAFPYHCPVCNKGYFDHYTLQEHLNAHKGLKVRTTDRLSVRSCFWHMFSIKLYFLSRYIGAIIGTYLHIQVHGCTGCGKKYQRKKNLVIHQRNCTGVPDTIQGNFYRSFVCPSFDIR